jgi:hypothetical protein
MVKTETEPGVSPIVRFWQAIVVEAAGHRLVAVRCIHRHRKYAQAEACRRRLVRHRAVQASEVVLVEAPEVRTSARG